MQAGPRLGAQLPREVCINVHISLVSYMVLPWKSVPEPQQDYQRRLWMLSEYIDALARNFIELDLAAAGESKVAATTLSLLGTFTALIEYFKATGANAKDMLASTFKVSEHTLSSFLLLCRLTIIVTSISLYLAAHTEQGADDLQ